MSKKCYRFFGGLLTAQEHWLNKMSEKGYRLIRAEKMLYEFEACKPDQVKYCVEFIGQKSKANASDYHEFLEGMGYKVFYKNINLNYSVSKVRLRPWAEKGGRIATNATTFNRELLIVEKDNDGKPFELHTSYEDKENYYRNLRNPWLLILLMFAIFAVAKCSVVFGVLALVSLIPVLVYQTQVGQNVLRYQNTYYTLSTERIPYRKDKTEDDRFFILTLFALAGEIEARGAYSSEVQRIQLAVGLPPAHFGAQVERFTQYFGQRGMVEFEVQGKPYSIYIEDVACFPQAYAAAATMLHTLVEEPKAVILDIGGFTADYLLMKNGEIDLTSCDSLENGVILLYNKVRSKVNSELDLLLDEGDVDAILMGKKTQYPDAAIRLTEQMAQEFINDLFSTLRERMLDLQYCKVVFVGGGAILLKRQIETSGKVGTPFFVPKINANADGYEYLYRIETAGR